MISRLEVLIKKIRRKIYY